MFCHIPSLKEGADWDVFKAYSAVAVATSLLPWQHCGHKGEGRITTTLPYSDS